MKKKSPLDPNEIDKMKLLKLPRMATLQTQTDMGEKIFIPVGVRHEEEKFDFEDVSTYLDYSYMKLKPDHAKRPIWVLPNRRILIETFSPSYRVATEFLISIAEPKSRPTMIHEYELTTSSLYSAISLKYTSEKIITMLSKLSKTIDVPREIKDFIRDHTANFGKARCVLHKNKYFIEVDDDEIYEKIYNLAPIQEYYKKKAFDVEKEDHENIAMMNTQKSSLLQMIEKKEDQLLEDFENMLDIDDDSAAVEENVNTKRIEFDPYDYEKIKKLCNDMMIPLKEEYEYAIPTPSNPELEISLKSTTQVRGYQAKALGKMFTNNRAQSGIIVLPCGAGKSLVGVCATAVIKKRTIVFCNSIQSVKQWVFQFKTWTNIDPKKILQFVSGTKKKQTELLDQISPENPVIVVTTYTMMYGTKGNDSEAVRAKLQSVEWGLAVLDEVHVVPANTFKEAITKIQSHCKLGLTATLLREDNKINNLEYLIGPKLYEENWKDLEAQGYLARVLCVEVRCEMNELFLKEYKRQTTHWKRTQLYLANPEKFFALQYLIRYHESRKDKILVFSDNIFLLTKYSKLLNKMCIHGKSSNEERIRVLDYFQKDDKYNVLFISKIGDTSIDLPDANVLIQISSFYGSRRQEAQRLGRILRPKEKSKARYNAFFYTIVSLDTEETHFSQKRQTFLVDQGFTFKILTNHDFTYSKDPYIKSTFQLSKEEDQKEFLIEVLALDDPRALGSESEDEDEEDKIQIVTTKVSGLGQNALQTLYIDYSKDQDGGDY